MSRLRLALALAACGLACGCLGNRGTPVFVDYAAAEVWSGTGMLLETSPDQRQCRVRFRDSHLITREQWVDCRYVHPRRR